jgi:hypothetical protein
MPSGEHAIADDAALDFTGTFEDCSQPCVAPIASRCFKSILRCYGMMVSLLLELGRDLIQPLEMWRPSTGNKTALSLQFGKITLQFPKFAGRDRLAPDCQHSHLLTY